MQNLALKSYAKINLTLGIGRKLKSNYHEISSIMQQINLYDIIYFKKIKQDKIIIKCNEKELENKDNLAFKAALLLKNKFNIKSGIEINIKKNMPIGSGMGAGSGNAASALMAMNKLFNLKLKNNELIKLAKGIGADVPFYIIGGTCFAEGIGERLKKIDSSKKINIVMVNPGFEISTKWAYEQYDKANIKKIIKISEKNKIKKLIIAIKNKDLGKISKNLFNDFEQIIFKKYPIIKKIKKDLIKNNALNALMSGSGSSVFGIFKDKTSAEKSYNNLKNKYPYVKLTTTIK